MGSKLQNPESRNNHENSSFSHRVGGNQKCNTIEERRSKIVRNSISDCHLSPYCHKWQSKTRFLSIFDLRSSIVDSIFNCCLPGVILVQTFVVHIHSKDDFS